MKNKLTRLSKSGVEYIDFAWGVFSGCRNHENDICPVPNCWAKAITKRFKAHYPNCFEPNVYPEALRSPLYLKKPARIGVGFMGDLIGYADPTQLLNSETGYMPFRSLLFSVIRQCPHDFLFLTKNPERLKLWSPFPDNAWVGVTTCRLIDAIRANRFMTQIEAKVNWLSIEPMYNWCLFSETMESILFGYDWVVIGAQTIPTMFPWVGQVRDIVKACDQLGIPVWLKYNLVGHLPIEEPFYTHDVKGWAIRHELPKRGKHE